MLTINQLTFSSVDNRKLEPKRQILQKERQNTKWNINKTRNLKRQILTSEGPRRIQGRYEGGSGCRGVNIRG